MGKTNKEPFNFGEFRKSFGSLSECSDRWRVSKGLISRWDRYERCIGSYTRRGGKIPPLSKVVFKDVKRKTGVSYEEYRAGWEYWNGIYNGKRRLKGAFNKLSTRISEEDYEKRRPRSTERQTVPKRKISTKRKTKRKTSVKRRTRK